MGVRIMLGYGIAVTYASCLEMSSSAPITRGEEQPMQMRTISWCCEAQCNTLSSPASSSACRCNRGELFTRMSTCV
ncbi:hypothetical protein EI94DRAFT_238071 [Lactarius quietus]|nr:hypothetical protein EI94DRAFT_238071 [Lactarius quietus]